MSNDSFSPVHQRWFIVLSGLLAGGNMVACLLNVLDRDWSPAALHGVTAMLFGAQATICGIARRRAREVRR
jgi:hypothetical protein